MKIALFFLTSLTVAFAQPKLDKNRFAVIDNSIFDCIYEYQVTSSDKRGEIFTDSYNTILQVGSKSTKFWDYNIFLADSVSYIASKASEQEKKNYTDRVMKSRNVLEMTIFQDYPSGSITVNDVITPNYYTYTEPSGVLNWELSSDTLSVCGHLCNKATTSYGGREWIVWYTGEVPVSMGPWKFAGLPGLVLQAQDSESIHLFKAIAIRKNSIPIYFEKQAGRVKITRDKFVENKIDFEKDPMKNIPVEAIGNMQVYKYGSGSNDKTAYINGVRLIMRPNGYIPLELK